MRAARCGIGLLLNERMFRLRRFVSLSAPWRPNLGAKRDTRNPLRLVVFADLTLRNGGLTSPADQACDARLSSAAQALTVTDVLLSFNRIVPCLVT